MNRAAQTNSNWWHSDPAKFLRRLALFLLPIGLLAYPLDRAYSYLLRQSHEYPGEFEVWNDIYASRASCDIAIIGSSRAWVHIDPAILSDTLHCSSYNFGVDGQNFQMQYFRYQQTVANNTKPKLIILSLDMLSLQHKYEKYNLDQFLPYLLNNKIIEAQLSPYHWFRHADFQLPFLRYLGKSESLLTVLKKIRKVSSDESYRTRGYRGMDMVWTQDFEKQKALHNHARGQINQEAFDLFRRFVGSCTQDGIPVVMVYSPEHIEGQKYITNRDSIILVYKNVAKQFQLPFLDYSDNSICREKHFFYNTMHLNTAGSKRFSAILAHDLKSITGWN